MEKTIEIKKEDEGSVCLTQEEVDALVEQIKREKEEQKKAAS